MSATRIRTSVNQKIQALEDSLCLNGGRGAAEPLFAGVDLGTAYIVTAVVNANGVPVAGALTKSRSFIRDGLVLDYSGAVSILRNQVNVLRKAGFAIHDAAAAYPPGTSGRNAHVFRNVLETVGLDVAVLTDEPSAASVALDITDGVVVDIGGGTTGISILQGGEVIYTADEPTGGIHVDLVLSGHFKISDDRAESLKRDPARQADIFPIICPVFEKMAVIVKHHLAAQPAQAADTLYLVGGTSEFPGIDEVMERETGLKVLKPLKPLLVTPLGIALSCLRAKSEPHAGRKET